MAHYMEHRQTVQDINHNIVKEGNTFQIEIALAGVKLADLDIEVAEGVMTISFLIPN